MAILSNLVVNQAPNTMKPLHLFSATLGKLTQRFSPLLTSLKSGILLVLLFVSLLFVASPVAHAQTATLTPQQVVEYALTLEKLEADFYQRGTLAAQSGSLSNAPQIVKTVITAYGSDEAQHVKDLSAVLKSLGGNPSAVTIPANPSYNAILGRDPFSNLEDFLLALQYVEDLGVAAYKGQAPNLLAANADTILAGALEIHSVEARHAAGIRYLRQVLFNADVRPWIRSANEVIYNENREGFPVPFADEAFDGFATRDEVLALVGPVLMPASQSSTSSGSPSAAALEGSITQADCPAGTTPLLVSGGYFCN